MAEQVKRVISEDNDIDGYYIRRKTQFLGKWIHHCGWYPDYINNSTSTISGNAQLCEEAGYDKNRFDRLVNICRSETKKITLVLKELEKLVNSMDIKTTNYANIPDAMFAIEDAIKKKMQELK